MNQSRRFPAIPLSVRAARHFTTQALTDSPADTTAAAELMVSELATNAIEHVMTSFFLTIDTTPQEIRIEVTDYGTGTPAIRPAGADALRGRACRSSTCSPPTGASHRPLMPPKRSGSPLL